MTTILTNLIGSGQYSNGTLSVTPMNAWVIWDGTPTRPSPKRFKIVDSVLYELDQATPASIPPSYLPDSFVPSGSNTPVVLYPDENYYKVELLQNAKKILTGFWKVPYDPADDGFTWATVTANNPDASTYPTPRYEDDGMKTYSTSGQMFAAVDLVAEGTVVYVSGDGTFWGRNSTTFVTFSGV